MSEPIKIVVTADTAQAAAAMTQFVTQAGGGLRVLSASAMGAASSLTEMRETALVTHEGFRTLQSSVLLLGGSSFPQLAMAVMGATEAIRAARSASMLTKIPLSEIGLIIAGIGAAATLGYLAWKDYGGGMETAEEKAKRLGDELKKIPQLLSDISAAQKAGAMSDAQANSFRDILSGRTPIYHETGSDGPGGTYDITTDARSQITSGRQKGNWRDNAPASVNNPDDLKNALAMIQKQSPDDAKDQQIAAQNEIDDLLRKSHEETLQGIEKEKAALDDKYAEDKTKLTDSAVSAKLTEVQLNDDLAALHADYISKKQELDDKAATEGAQKTAEAQSKLREQYAKEFADANKQIETDITNTAAQESKKREDFFMQEYVEKSATALKFYLTGKITEQEYEASVEAAQTAALDGANAVNSALDKQNQLRDEGARRADEMKLKQIESDPFLTSHEKAQKSIPVLNDQLADNSTDQKQEEAAMAVAKQKNDLSAQELISQHLNELATQRVEIENKIEAAQDQNSVGKSFLLDITALQSKLPTLAQSMASVFVSPFAGMQSGFNSALTNMMEHGGTFKNFMLTVGTGIEKSFIQSVSSMVSSYVTGLATMLVKQIGTDATSTAVTVAGSRERGAASFAEGEKHLFATAMGAAHSVASIPYIGWALALLAFASVETAGNAILAATGGAGFYAGGYTGDGAPHEIAGVVHRGEFVVPASTVNRLGLGPLEAMTRGDSGSRSQPASSGNGSGSEKFTHKTVIVYDRQELLNELKSGDAEKITVAHVFKNRRQAGINT